jgi:hypothetical protein
MGLVKATPLRVAGAAGTYLFGQRAHRDAGEHVVTPASLGMVTIGAGR